MKAAGINKATAYLHRICTVEYDMQGMIGAYGIEFCHYLLDEIAAGRVNCKQDVDRWSAHVAINKDYNFNQHVSVIRSEVIRKVDNLDTKQLAQLQPKRKKTKKAA